jgi:hypothetical protein
LGLRSVAGVLKLSDPAQPTLALLSQPRGRFQLFLAAAAHPPTPVHPPTAVRIVRSAVSPDGWHIQMDVESSPFADLFVDFRTSSGGGLDAASAVMFNPQPDPPDGFGAPVGLDFTFTSMSDVFVTLRMFDAQSNPVTFQAVPEPASWLLLSSGLAFGAKRRVRARPRSKRHPIRQ